MILLLDGVIQPKHLDMEREIGLSIIYLSFMISLNMLSQAASGPGKKRTLFPGCCFNLFLLKHTMEWSFITTMSYDMNTYVFLMHLLTWKFFHICCKHGRIQWYVLLQCDFVYGDMLLAFHRYYTKQCSAGQLQFLNQSWSSLTWSGHQDLDHLR